MLELCTSKIGRSRCAQENIDNAMYDLFQIECQESGSPVQQNDSSTCLAPYVTPPTPFLRYQ